MTAIRVSITVDTHGIEIFRASYPDMKSHNEIISMLVERAWQELEDKPVSWPKPIETWLKVNNGYRSKAPDGRWALIMMNFKGKLFGKWDGDKYVSKDDEEYNAEEIVELFRRDFHATRIRAIK